MRRARQSAGFPKSAAKSSLGSPARTGSEAGARLRNRRHRQAGLPARPGVLKAAVMAFLRPMAAYPQSLPGALRGLSAAVVTEAGDEPRRGR